MTNTIDDGSDSSITSSNSRILVTMVSFIWFPYTTIVLLIVVQLATAFIVSPTTSPVPTSNESHLPLDRLERAARSSLKAKEGLNIDTRTASPSPSQCSSSGPQTHRLPPKVWYSHPDISRDRSKILSDDDDRLLKTLLDDENSKFILSTPTGMYYETPTLTSSEDGHNNDDDDEENNVTIPLYLTPSEMDAVLKSSNNLSLENLTPLSTSGVSNEEAGDATVRDRTTQQQQQQQQPLLMWIGSYNDTNYWAVHIWTIDDDGIGDDDNYNGNDESADSSSKLLQPLARSTYPCKPLREYGDTIVSSFHAGIAATANGLIEFHKSHKFCTLCGSPTIPAKLGSCRQCTNSKIMSPSLSSSSTSSSSSSSKTDTATSNEGMSDKTCKSRSVYPRIDVATIMLITSPCNNFALLGRKKFWPKGRFSTLAGFCEVGETFEECCIRETYEESGVHVDESSVRFVASQPWPFPRSMMVGFHARAKPTTIIASPDNAQTNSDSSSMLPPIVVDTNEMEDIQWFRKDFVRRGITSSAGSTALNFQPDDAESIFHIPGRSSLARILISQWAMEDDS